MTLLLSDVREFIEYFSKDEKEEILKRFQNKKKLKMVFGADIRLLIGCFFYKTKHVCF